MDTSNNNYVVQKSRREKKEENQQNEIILGGNMTFGHKIDPIGYLTRNRRVIITNDKEKVDFIEFVFSNSRMQINGMINAEEQGIVNECVEVLKTDEKKDSMEMKETKEDVNNVKYSNIVNWRSCGYYGEVQFI